MEHEQPRDRLGAGELAAEQQVGDLGADHRDRQHGGPDDLQAHPGQQVVGQRVAGQALGHRQQQHRDADHPGALAGPAEGAGEEDAAQVQHDRRDEHQRGPVVGLAHQQPGGDLEEIRITELNASVTGWPRSGA